MFENALFGERERERERWFLAALVKLVNFPRQKID